MLTKEEIRYLKETLPQREGPLLSLYLDTHPTREENLGKAYALRAKAAMKALGVPEGVAQEVLLRLDEPPEGRTRALFAGEGFLESYAFHVDFPLVDGVLAHYGEPFLAPLLFALDEYERYGVVYVDRERWRFFTLHMGEIAEREDAFLALDPSLWREITLSREGRRLQQGRNSGGAGMDLFQDRLEAWQVRFYKEVARLLEKAVEEEGARRLLLMGPEAQVRLFEGFLPRHLAERVAARLPSLQSPGARPGEVLKRAEEVLAQAEREEERALLRRLEEQGVFGPEVLTLLQEGRVYLLVLPWVPEARVQVCPEGVYASLEGVPCPAPEEKPLALVIPGLAEAYGTRLEFVHGEAQQGLLERGGMAALLRW